MVDTVFEIFLATALIVFASGYSVITPIKFFFFLDKIDANRETTKRGLLIGLSEALFWPVYSAVKLFKWFKSLPNK